MSITVYTETVCDSCGGTETEEGEQGVPPVDWSCCTLNTRLKGDGWGNSTDIMVSLCPACTRRVKKMLSKAAEEEK